MNPVGALGAGPEREAVINPDQLEQIAGQALLDFRDLVNPLFVNLAEGSAAGNRFDHKLVYLYFRSAQVVGLAAIFEFPGPIVVLEVGKITPGISFRTNIENKNTAGG